MALGDHLCHVIVGFDFSGHFVAQDVDEVVARKHAGGDFTMGQAFFGEEHQGDHDQRHVVMPGLPAARLIVGHATSALGIFEGALNEVAVGLHAGQSA